VKIQERAYDWLCYRKYRAQGLAVVTSGLMWVGLIEGWRVGHKAVAGIVSDVRGNLAWLWQAGGDSWAGPLRWALATSAAMTVWFVGVGIVEWWNRKGGNE
jgi:hypothetical protein